MTKKSVTPTEIRELARATTKALTGAEISVDEVIDRIQLESAGVRLDVLQSIYDEYKNSRRPLPQINVSRLLCRLMDPGSKGKANFAARYINKLFESAAIAGQEHRNFVLQELFSEFLTTFSANKKESRRVLSDETMQAVAESRSFADALNLSLVREDGYRELKREFSVWSIVIPELAGRSSIPLSTEAANAILQMVSELKQPICGAMRLSLKALQELASPRAGQAPSGESSTTPERASVAVEDRFCLPAFAATDRKIAAAILALNDDVGARLKAQSETSERLESQRSDAQKVVGQLKDELKSLEERSGMLERLLGDLRSKNEAQRDMLATSEEQLAEFRRSFSGVASASELREAEAIEATKRAFVERQLPALVSLRDYLEVLRDKPSQETAVLAIANFNRLVKFLNAEKYIGANDLQAIRTPEHGGRPA